MTRDEILLKFECSLEDPPEPGTLTGAELCSNLAGWNSLAVVAFISVINKGYGIILQPARLVGCRSVNDVIELVLNQSAGGPVGSPR
jgi:acyl carrier protein